MNVEMNSRAVSFAVVIALTALPRLVAHAQTDTAAPAPAEVRTAANAERSVRPDVATFTLSFTATGASPMAAGQALAARADSLRRALQTLGIPRDSLVSGSRWYWWRGRVEIAVSPPRYIQAPPDARGNRSSTAVLDTTYRATDAIDVRIHDLRKVGPAIDTALAHGIVEISTVRFEATDVSGAQESALREATDRARRQAAAIAEASGGRLGRTRSLSTERDGPDNLYGALDSSLSVSAFTGGAERGTEVVEPAIKVRVTVYGRWELIVRP